MAAVALKMIDSDLTTTASGLMSGEQREQTQFRWATDDDQDHGHPDETVIKMIEEHANAATREIEIAMTVIRGGGWRPNLDYTAFIPLSKLPEERKPKISAKCYISSTCKRPKIPNKNETTIQPLPRHPKDHK